MSKVAFLIVFIVAGCSYLPAIGPNYKAVQLDVPTAYREAASISTTTSVQPYWERLGDPTLTTLAQKALSQSLTLKQAWQRIKQTRAASGMAMAALGPQVQGQGGYQGQRIGAQANLVNGTTQTLDIYSAGVGANWELDIFGGNRRALEGAWARTEAAEAAANAMSSALLAEVARQYLTFRALQQQVVFAQQQVSSTAALATLVGHQARVGVADGAMLAQAQAREAASRMALAPLQAAVSAAQYQLESVLGEKPGSLAEVLAQPVPLPAVPTSSTLVLPSELILQRPDLKMREREAAAATAAIGVAMADLFPRFSLTGSFGVQGPNPTMLDHPTALVWNGGPSFRWALFASGQIWNNVNLHKAKQREAVLAYQQAALDALAEVESNLARHHAATQALQAGAALAQASAKQAHLATLQHAKGAINGLMWHEALLAQAQGEQAATQAHVNALLAYVQLHQSLGL
ncbi:MAG: efflux transporter outer membrane subunit [Alphaproteobacteria bacterium]